jgi:lupus La protein
MSDIKMEGQEPIATPAPTNEDVAVKTEAAEPITEEQVESGDAETKEEKADAEVKQEVVDSTSAEVKEEKTDSDIKAEIKEEDILTEEQKKNPTLKNGHTRKERTYESGVLKTTAQIDPSKKSNSKYDASVLPPSDDAGLIRAQVKLFLSVPLLCTDLVFKGRILPGRFESAWRSILVESYRRLREQASSYLHYSQVQAHATIPAIRVGS